jgi:hypothetical protein
MEACGTANFWARVLVVLGHEAKTIPPSYTGLHWSEPVGLFSVSDGHYSPRLIDDLVPSL